MASITLSGRTLLLVEDEPIIALDIASAFTDAGASVTIAATLDEAIRLVEQGGWSAAVLDFGGDSNPLCASLRDRGIPFILHSGHGHPGDACLGGMVIPKPADPECLVAAVARSLQHRAST